MSQFAFAAEFKEFHGHAVRAEETALADPRGSALSCRLAAESMVDWLYQADRSLKYPYSDNLNALINEPSFKRAVGPTILNKLHLVRKIGNLAAHRGKFADGDAQKAVGELFHIAWWLAHNYARHAPGPQQFDPAKLPRKQLIDRTTLQRAAALVKQHEELRDQHQKAVEDAKRQSEQARAEYDAELKRLRDEIAEIKATANDRSETHDYNEARTRHDLIDVLLKEAGWPLDQTRDREFEVTGMPSQTGTGYVDYVLWGKDGTPLGLVEAKKTTVDANAGQRQAELYADCLEKQFGVRPLIFYTNGYDHWFWDDANHPPREVQGFFDEDKLSLLIQRRGNARALSSIDINRDIAGGQGRTYQERAIRRVCERFETEKQREALLVMATGSGKTRMSIALVDLLMRAGWVKTVLFLADRKELVKQAANAFTQNLPDVPTVNLLTEKNSNARVYVSTYPTMLNLIDRDLNDGVRRFGPGAFDLVIIDEAHRSVYRKYKAIFDYFDSYLVGLTATPVDEIDRNTYELFHQEDGVPTDAYTLAEAVKDGWLVPPKAIDVPIKFPREGIKYDDLSDEEKEEWDALEWGEDGPPDEVSGAALNDWLFNTDTIDKVLQHLMQNAYYIDDGERIAKTIIFAKSARHAALIVERFNYHYPELAGKVCRQIDYSIKYADTLVDAFKNPESGLQIAVSVDMLDTGIDVPEIANLVFFKIVRSKSKFWQMIGRGTRLCPDLYAPGDDKEDFLVFDFLENFEFFNSDVPVREASVVKPLQERLFEARVEAVGLMQPKAVDGGVRDDPVDLEGAPETLLETLRGQLKSDVFGMNLDNFIVRTERRSVERFQNEEVWKHLTLADRQELIDKVAGLPTTITDTDVDAKRFDLLCLQVQLGLLKKDDVTSLKKRMQDIAAHLEGRTSIAQVAAELELIQEIRTSEFWDDVTPQMIEHVRRRLRGLVRLIDKTGRKQLTTNFLDQIGEAKEVELEALKEASNFRQFREKTEAYLRAHKDHIALQKLRRGVPLTDTDLSAVEEMLIEGGVGNADQVHALATENGGLAGYVRSVVGMDRNAVAAALNKAVSEAQGAPATGQQLDFLNKLVDWLSEKGRIDPAKLWEKPFTDQHPAGVSGIFDHQQSTAIVSTIRSLTASDSA